MERAISATEARAHWGRLMRQVVEAEAPTLVTWRGEEQVVVLSVRRYRGLTTGDAAVPHWLELPAEARAAVAVDLDSRQLPDAAEVVRQGREDRDAQLRAALQR